MLFKGVVNPDGRSCPFGLANIVCLVLYEITRFLRETYQYMPKKLNNPSAYKIDMISTTGGMMMMGGGGGAAGMMSGGLVSGGAAGGYISTRQQRNERSKQQQPLIGSLISNDSNPNSMVTPAMIKADFPSTGGGGGPQFRGPTTSGIEISQARHSSNDNISFGDFNSEKHITFAIIKDGNNFYFCFYQN